MWHSGLKTHTLTTARVRTSEMNAPSKRRAAASSVPRPSEPHRGRRPLTDRDIGLIWDTIHLPQKEAMLIMGLGSVSSVESRRRMVRNPAKYGSNGASKAWNQDDEDFIFWAFKSLTALQIARHLGRTEEAVQSRIFVMQARGDISYRTLFNKSPNMMGRRTLLAQTCRGCGLLLGKEWFKSPKTHGGGWATQCARCRNAANLPYRERGRMRRKAAVARLQQVTIEHAEKRGQPWTEAEMKILSDSSISHFEKAIKLKRTLCGVATAVIDYGFSSSPWRGNPEDGQWRILFGTVAAA